MTASLPTRQAPGIHHRRFGDLYVTALSDGYVELPAAAYINADAEAAKQLQHEAFLPAVPQSAVNAYLVRSKNATVLIDTGAGGMMGPTAGLLRENLTLADVAPEQVDVLLMTHMHGDHFGGALLPDGRPTFPNAQIMLSAVEAAYWRDAAAVPDRMKANVQGVQRVVDAYQGKVKHLDAGLPAGIAAHPLPGHTPGHTGYIVGSGAERVLIWGDVFHLPALQIRRPEIGVGFDSDPALAQKTRRETLEMAASERMMVAGMHMDFPGFAHIARTGGGYGLVWSAWAPAL